MQVLPILLRNYFSNRMLQSHFCLDISIISGISRGLTSFGHPFWGEILCRRYFEIPSQEFGFNKLEAHFVYTLSHVLRDHVYPNTSFCHEFSQCFNSSISSRVNSGNLGIRSMGCGRTLFTIRSQCAEHQEGVGLGNHCFIQYHHPLPSRIRNATPLGLRSK